MEIIVKVSEIACILHVCLNAVSNFIIKPDVIEERKKIGRSKNVTPRMRENLLTSLEKTVEILQWLKNQAGLTSVTT